MQKEDEVEQYESNEKPIRRRSGMNKIINIDKRRQYQETK